MVVFIVCMHAYSCIVSYNIYDMIIQGLALIWMRALTHLLVPVLIAKLY